MHAMILRGLELGKILYFFWSGINFRIFSQSIDFQMHFKGRNSVNREGIFFGISPNREDIAAAIEKSNVIVRKGAYEHVALTVTQVK